MQHNKSSWRVTRISIFCQLLIAPLSLNLIKAKQLKVYSRKHEN